MRVNEHKLIEWCVEIGVTRGIARAHKHNETPDRDTIETSCVREVMHEISEWFQFDEEGGDRGVGRFNGIGGKTTQRDL